jgi:alanine racemase
MEQTMNAGYHMKAATAVIDRRALKDNLNYIRTLAPNSKVMAVVKANGYGHGLLETALTLEQADSFGVARISEALTLRAGGIVKPILLLEGFLFEKELPILVANSIETVVHSVEQIEALEQAKLIHPIVVWLKMDTGMHRLGVRPEQVDEFYQRLSRCPNVVQPINLMSHFSRADEPDCDATPRQISTFARLTAAKPGERSLAASGGILLWPASHYDWIRPGIITYGASPLADKSARELGLRPAMTLKSSLIAVRDHKAGEPVGYNAMWTSERDTRLGVVAIGYGDGYPRCAPSGTPVWINGRLVPIVGRVSMDMISVDLGPQATERVGDEAVLWGEQLPVEKVAEYTGVSAYELLTKLTGRVVIEYIND